MVLICSSHVLSRYWYTGTDGRHINSVVYKRITCTLILWNVDLNLSVTSLLHIDTPFLLQLFVFRSGSVPKGLIKQVIYNKTQHYSTTLTYTIIINIFCICLSYYLPKLFIIVENNSYRYRYARGEPMESTEGNRCSVGYFLRILENELFMYIQY